MTTQRLTRQNGRELIAGFADEFADVAFERLLKLVKCCPNCFFFNEPLELCKCSDANARPPARVIAHGCNEFLDKEEIPF
jgi:hypothetical protein